jgi:DNA-binding transcriptional MerR regulator
MNIRTWKVGGLGRITGLSIRTLHYYEEMGLLIPSNRTASGHRVYGEKDLLRLQQILSLKQLGFPLVDIMTCLNEKKMFPVQIIRAHKNRMEEEKSRIEKIYGLLSSLEKTLEAKKKIPIDEVIKTMKEITMYEKYFTKEQLEKISERRKALGKDKLKSLRGQWRKLIKAVRVEMARQTHPNDPKVQKLAKQWRKLCDLWTQGDINLSLGYIEMNKKEPQAQKIEENFGIDSKVKEYVGKFMYCFHINRGALKKKN